MKRKTIKGRKHRKTQKKYTRKYKGGDFNKYQIKELKSLLKEKGLNKKQIENVMDNLNPISQQFTTEPWYIRLKFEISLLHPNNIANWAAVMYDVYIGDVETDDDTDSI